MNCEVVLGIGSNINAENNICKCIEHLNNQFQVKGVSDWVIAPAVGFKGDDFINAVVIINYPNDLLTLKKQLNQIEIALGRDKQAPKFAAKNIDIDILCFKQWHGVYFDISLPRAELYLQPYALQPLAQLKPEHGIAGKRINAKEQLKLLNQPALHSIKVN